MKIYSLYYKAMYNSAYRIIKDPYLAEDIMQESFIKAFDKLDTLKNLTAFGSWLKSIVINRSIKQYQQVKDRKEINLNHEIQWVEHSEPDMVNIDEEHSIESSTLWTIIQKLPQNYFEIINLYYIEGMDYEEIGDLLNISYGNCRTMMSRAKSKIKEGLNKLKEVK